MWVGQPWIISLLGGSRRRPRHPPIEGTIVECLAEGFLDWLQIGVLKEPVPASSRGEEILQSTNRSLLNGVGDRLAFEKAEHAEEPIMFFEDRRYIASGDRRGAACRSAPADSAARQPTPALLSLDGSIRVADIVDAQTDRDHQVRPHNVPTFWARLS